MYVWFCICTRVLIAIRLVWTRMHAFVRWKVTQPNFQFSSLNLSLNLQFRKTPNFRKPPVSKTLGCLIWGSLRFECFEFGNILLHLYFPFLKIWQLLFIMVFSYALKFVGCCSSFFSRGFNFFIRGWYIIVFLVSSYHLRLNFSFHRFVVVHRVWTLEGLGRDMR